MQILIDTREQLPLWSRRFQSTHPHLLTFCTLPEGDYTTARLQHSLVIERKSPSDLYSTLLSNHSRFKREILRCAAKSTVMVIAIESTYSDFFSAVWMPTKLRYSKHSFKRLQSLRKMIVTMSSKYPHIHFRWFQNRQHMREYIIRQFISAESELDKHLNTPEYILK